MKYIIVIIAVIGLIAFGAMNYHLIRTDDGFEILKKADRSFENIYVDARGAKKLKLILNPALVKSGIKDLLEKQGIELETKK